MKRIVYIIISLLVVASPLSAEAQEQTWAMPFAVLPDTPSEIAMAGVGLSSRSSDCADVRLGYMSYAPEGDKTDYYSLTGRYKMNDKLSFSFSGVYGLCMPYVMVNEGGFEEDSFTPSQMKVVFGASYAFCQYLSVVAKTKLLTESLAPEASYSSFAADLAVMSEYGIDESSSIVAQAGLFNFGIPVKSVTGIYFPLPTSVGLKCLYARNINGEDSLEAKAAADVYLKGSLSATVAMSYTYRDMIAVRAGYRYGGESVLPSFASAGLGIKFAGVSLDLAYLFAGETLSNTLCVGLGYSF